MVDVDREVEIVLVAAAVVSGEVVASGRPAAGVSVRVEVSDPRDRRGLLAGVENRDGS
jgi:hypothetical protein